MDSPSNTNSGKWSFSMWTKNEELSYFPSEYRVWCLNVLGYEPDLDGSDIQFRSEEDKLQFALVFGTTKVRPFKFNFDEFKMRFFTAATCSSFKRNINV